MSSPSDIFQRLYGSTTGNGSEPSNPFQQPPYDLGAGQIPQNLAQQPRQMPNLPGAGQAPQNLAQQPPPIPEPWTQANEIELQRMQQGLPAIAKQVLQGIIPPGGR